MQPNIAGYDIVLLGGTFSLLTHGCHRGIPQGIRGMSERLLLLADKHSRTQFHPFSPIGVWCVESSWVRAVLVPVRGKGVLYLDSTLDLLFVTHPAGIRAQQGSKEKRETKST